MNQMNKIEGTKSLVFLAMLLFVVFAMMGCEQNSVGNIAGPDDTYSADTPESSFSKPGKGIGKAKGGKPGLHFPITKSKTFHYNPSWNVYKGGTLKIGKGQGSHFHINDSALTPPPHIPWGDDVTITMEVDYDSTLQEMLFTFGPSGCQFSPSARIKLDYSVLGIDRPQLYYIDENGNYIPQTPNYINFKRKFMVIDVDHFSRYALARS